MKELTNVPARVAALSVLTTALASPLQTAVCTGSISQAAALGAACALGVAVSGTYLAIHHFSAKRTRTPPKMLAARW